MKNHILFVLLFASFIFSACEDEETTKSEISSVSVDGNLSGKIEKFVSGDIDSIQVYGLSNLILGSCNVSATGSFSINLQTQNLNPPMLIGSLLLNEFEGNVSNESASILYASLICFKDGHIIGSLVKCNFSADQTSDNVGISSDSYSKGVIFGKVGSALSSLVSRLTFPRPL